MSGGPFGNADLRRLEAHGVPIEDAAHQLELLTRPRRFTRLVRACTIGDGIVCLTPREIADLHEYHDAAAAAGRLLKFVPASGAATRMFRELTYFLKGTGRDLSRRQLSEQAAAGQAEACALEMFVDHLERFAFYGDLAGVFEGRGETLPDVRTMNGVRNLLEGLLSERGLDYAALPKGLIKFHAYADGARTAFEEQLAEAAAYVRDAEGRGRLHFTVSPGHEARFRARFGEIGEGLGQRHDTRFEVTYSTQRTSTDTLAVDVHDRPFRDASGDVLFRPGGHGALIENLAELGGDLVYIKNIDNVQPTWSNVDTLQWKKTLAGCLLSLQEAVFGHVARLKRGRSSAALRGASEFVRERLRSVAELDGASPERLRQDLLRLLDRPLRVCGVVPNTGEPGGGPFWVADDAGQVSRQLVETAQVDPEDEEQQAILRGSTHFSPVDLVCGLRDFEDRPFDLHGFIDTEAVIVARKSFEGRELKALERPGLWNGAMARWITVFVEVPLTTFTPVKSVLDLLRPEHQPPGAAR